MKLNEMKKEQLSRVIKEAKKELCNRKKLAESKARRNERQLNETVVYESDEYSIIELETARQAARHNKGTNWALSDPRMFDRYSKDGPIYVVKDHFTGKKYGVHTASDTYIDENDIPVSYSTLRRRFPEVGMVDSQSIRESKRKKRSTKRR